jgi:hypothetical protein
MAACCILITRFEVSEALYMTSASFPPLLTHQKAVPPSELPRGLDLGREKPFRWLLRPTSLVFSVRSGFCACLLVLYLLLFCLLSS